MDDIRSYLKHRSIKSLVLIVIFVYIILSPEDSARAGLKKLSDMTENFLPFLWGSSTVRKANNGQVSLNNDKNNKNENVSIVFNERYKTYKVALDPGHGGKPEKAGLTEGDHWDIKVRKFLTRYNYGAYYKTKTENETEHEIVLYVCQKAFEILRNANTDEGWREFSRLLSVYGVKKPAEYRRVNFDVNLMRADSYESSVYSGEVNVNKHFRLFDSPDSFNKDGVSSEKLFPGRMSKVNAVSPQLVLCVHINSSSNSSTRGQASVIIPDYHVFDFVKTVKSRLGVKKALAYFWVLSWFYIDNPVISNLSKLINDCETYFTGRRSDNKSQIGKRWQMVMWRYNKDDEYDNLLNYKDPDSYWKRERSDYESMRRAGGIIRAGGDNFYASEEVIKFIRFALWQDYLNTAPSSPEDMTSIKGPCEYLGMHGAPFISDWALPQLINAVTAYVELGYIENDNDRTLLVNKKDIIARALAVSAYSLCEGFEPKKLPLTKEEALKNKFGPVNKITLDSSGRPEKATSGGRISAVKSYNKVQRKKIDELVDNLKNEMKGGGALKLKQTFVEDGAERKIIGLTPLVLPFSQRIDFEKYGNYFKSVLK